MTYAWTPIDGFICVRALRASHSDRSNLTDVYPQLYKVNSTAPRVLARVARGQNMVLLEITSEAMNLGLLESCMVATVMLTCGHNID